MKSKIFVYGACVLALVACNQEKQASAAITPNSTDDQKFAYMLGIQMGEHAFGPLARQMGEYVNQNALIQGVRDMVKSSKDTSFKMQLVPDTIGAINSHYAAIARERYEATRPDSATIATRDRAGLMAYSDSVKDASRQGCR
jgi:Domain amino terminal to FKBP-type peptidyl-prolyl isomerase.